MFSNISAISSTLIPFVSGKMNKKSISAIIESPAKLNITGANPIAAFHAGKTPISTKLEVQFMNANRDAIVPLMFVGKYSP